MPTAPSQIHGEREGNYKLYQKRCITTASRREYGVIFLTLAVAEANPDSQSQQSPERDRGEQSLQRTNRRLLYLRRPSRAHKL